MTTHEAGRELDAEIAVRVFGWTWEPSRNDADRMLVPPDERRAWAAVWDAAGRPDWLPEHSTLAAAPLARAERGGR
jgi:hypothetical protein